VQRFDYGNKVDRDAGAANLGFDLCAHGVIVAGCGESGVSPAA
jgi:hypothetical protein